MNRKSKVIVSIVGITIVLLALLGITYAYYLTRIEGNTNTNSISITTADLKLVYRDGNGDVTKENIMPGTTIEKTFTVKNDGNGIIDNYAVYLEEITNTLTRTEDLTYTLTCESTGEDCVGSSGEYPKLSSIVATNSIEVGETHTFTLTVTYANHETIDQSIDMGSTIAGFVQIYAMSDVIDIKGTTTGVSEGDFMQINSVQKRSQIVDGEYTLAGLLPGNHTIKVCGATDTNCESPKLTKQIIINVGTEAKVEDNIITMTSESQTVNVDIDVTNTTTTIGTSIKEYNPFEEGTLAYNIYKNSKENKNGTKYVEKSLTKIGDSSYYSEGKFADYEIIMPENQLNIAIDEDISVLENMYWGDSNINYPEKCLEEYKGYYLIDYMESNFGKGKGISKILRCNGDNFVVDREIYNKEIILTKTEDDYGISYYYRGDVKDNYLNFGGMCWRIVRIEGDGSIKIVLDDANTTCNNASYKNNWVIPGGEYGYTLDYVTNSNGETTSKQIYLRDYLGGKTNVSNSAHNKFNSWLINKKIDTSKLKMDKWCLGNLTDIYNEGTGVKITTPINDLIYNEENFILDSYRRIYGIGVKQNITYKCNMENYETFDSYIATLTVDEYIYAGAPINANGNTEHYLYSSNSSISMTLTLAYFENYFNSFIGFWMHPDGGIDYEPTVIDRPAITLKSRTLIESGDGTKTKPYVIK